MEAMYAAGAREGLSGVPRVSGTCGLTTGSVFGISGMVSLEFYMIFLGSKACMVHTLHF